MKMRWLLTFMCVIVLVLTGCRFAPAPVAIKPTLPPVEVEIYEVNVGNYRTSYDVQGRPEPDFVKATFSWKTNKPCFFWFEINPVDFDTPYNSSTLRPYDINTPLIQQVKHEVTIILRPGALHSYVLVVWDRERDCDRRQSTFQVPGGSSTAGSPPSLKSSIDDIFLSRWGHTYYNDASRVSFSSFDIDKLLIQISLQIPWQLYYKAGDFDCSEMTAYLEYVLERHGFTAEIAHGEVKGIGRHAWVLVYNNAADCWVPIEATSLTGTLDASLTVLFQWITEASLIDYLKPNWKSVSIYDVVAIWEYDWWNSPYADQLVAASDRAKVSKLELPPLPKIKYAPLPDEED